MIAALLSWKAGLIGAWFLLFFVGEQVRPWRLGQVFWQKAQWSRRASNLALFGMNALASLVVVIPLSAWAAGVAPAWRSGILDHPVSLVLDILILDAFIYWWHRCNHEIPFLWRFHEVHHLDRTLDTTTAVRFHLGEVCLSALVRVVPIVVFNIPLTSVILAELLLLLASIFQHSNLRLPARLERALTLVIVTPSWHWMHHHRHRADTDSNYGNLLTLWDRLFDSQSRNQRHREMLLGVASRGDRSFLGLLLRPMDPP